MHVLHAGALLSSTVVSWCCIAPPQRSPESHPRPPQGRRLPALCGSFAMSDRSTIATTTAQAPPSVALPAGSAATTHTSGYPATPPDSLSAVAAHPNAPQVVSYSSLPFPGVEISGLDGRPGELSSAGGGTPDTSRTLISSSLSRPPIPPGGRVKRQHHSDHISSPTVHSIHKERSEFSAVSPTMHSQSHKLMRHAMGPPQGLNLSGDDVSVGASPVMPFLPLTAMARSSAPRSKVNTITENSDDSSAVIPLKPSTLSGTLLHPWGHIHCPDCMNRAGNN